MTQSFAFIPFDVGSNLYDCNLLACSQFRIYNKITLFDSYKRLIAILAPHEFSILNDRSSLPRDAADAEFAHSTVDAALYKDR